MMRKFTLATLLGMVLVESASSQAVDVKGSARNDVSIFRRDNLVAWCIVPFDGKKRNPVQRANMIQRLGIRRVAYDWRAEHVASFEQEILEYKQRKLDYFAFWATHPEAFRLFEKHQIHPQVWQIAASPTATTQSERIRIAAGKIRPLVEQTRKLGCKLGLYNHGGWSGEPQNLVELCRYLRKHDKADHVGIVYNLHHAHHRIAEFKTDLERMMPYLYCLNLNGMTKDGDKNGNKILPLGAGEYDVELLRTIQKSSYRGPIGIIGHTQDDVEQRLQDNLDGLEWIVNQLRGKPAGPRPEYRTWKQAPQNQEPKKPSAARNQSSNAKPTPTKQARSELNAVSIAAWIDQASQQGDILQGLSVFASDKTACLSCHRIAKHGGSVGPDLTSIAKDRSEVEIVESIFFPRRKIDPKYHARLFVTDDGKTHRGYLVSRDDKQVVITDPHNDTKINITTDEIVEEADIGSLMPENLMASLTKPQIRHLLRFLLSLGKKDGIAKDELDTLLAHQQTHRHGPVPFPIERKPLRPEYHPNWKAFVNRDRIYDWYTKQANFFRGKKQIPKLLTDFPGMDGGQQGHWGNQNDAQTWKNDQWNHAILGTVQSAIFYGAGKPIPRAVCVRIPKSPGQPSQLFACFNPDTLTYDQVWSGEFLKFSDVRNGFLHGAKMAGRPVTFKRRTPQQAPFQYRGFHRSGEYVLFDYSIDGIRFLDMPTVKDGKFQPIVAPEHQHPFRNLVDPESPSNKQAKKQIVIKTPIQLGKLKPYATDTITLPTGNPTKTPMFVGGLAFLPDGAALICTMHGDVWKVSGFDYPSTEATWTRFATGLHHCLGMVVDHDGIFVLCRDQITRLHDLNRDGVADFYECFSNAFVTSAAGHDFICGLQRDNQGRFYTASGNQGIVRISKDGKRARSIATGFRNPDGLGLLPDGSITVPCSEGEWTPASMICRVPANSADTFHGYKGPREGQEIELPLVYLPRGLDNSSGGQTVVNSDRWGPLKDQLIHFSFGSGNHFLVLQDEVNGQHQGAIVPLPGEFLSGIHRGRFRPQDGQLYVAGMQGWGSYTTQDGCLQRVRFTGGKTQFPIRFKVHQNGVQIEFSSLLDRSTISEASNHFAQCWNYRYGPGYGSAEFSTLQTGVKGHDALWIKSVHLLKDGKTLFVQIPEIQPVNQLHLQVASSVDVHHDLFITVHQLDDPFTEFDGFAPVDKEIAPHPLVADLTRVNERRPNPFQKPIKGARLITIKTGTNLSFQPNHIKVKASEPIELKFANTDVVPHNVVLIQPGSLKRVGKRANQLISDANASIRQYVPDSEDVLVYTDVVLPREDFSIFFHAPKKAGRYPFLCTFPGHWLVMNGQIDVE